MLKCENRRRRGGGWFLLSRCGFILKRLFIEKEILLNGQMNYLINDLSTDCSTVKSKDFPSRSF